MGYRVIEGNGVLCPKCKKPTQIREHRRITEKQLKKAFYYSRWFYCLNPNCVTTLYMLPEYAVYPQQVLSPEEKKLEPILNQLGETPPWEDETNPKADHEYQSKKAKSENLVRIGKPDGDFWAKWRKNKAKMKALGYRVRKVNGNWEILTVKR
jgi:hypothetical protein